VKIIGYTITDLHEIMLPNTDMRLKEEITVILKMQENV